VGDASGVNRKEHTVKIAIATLSVVLAAFLGFIASSCGAGEGAEAVGPVPSATAPQAAEETVETAGTVETSEEEPEEVETLPSRTFELWFTKGENLYLSHRVRRTDQRVGTAALRLLIEEGPGNADLATAIPADTKVLGLVIEDGIAHVDLSSEFESGGGSLSMQMRLAQVVYTLTQFPTVKGVLFELDGRPVDVIGGEGIVVDHPLTRKDFADFLYPIVVTTPVAGQTVGNPVQVSGTANVFEANVTVVVLDEAGKEVGRTFTTATCGSGCRGAFSVAVPYEVSRQQSGTILVQDDDAAGTGRPPHEVRIAVVLSP
jgi:germination protein M